MEITKLKSRSLLFVIPAPQVEWDVKIHLIHGEHYDYLIDTGLGPDCIGPIREHLDPGKPLFVINTHHHWDHVWGNCALDGSVIIAHASCPALIAEKWDANAQKFRRFFAGAATMRLPGLLFESSLYFAGDGIRLFHSPGHTADSISVLDERDGVLNAGDNIGDSADEIVPSLACSVDEYKSTLALYQGMDFDTVVSGHNSVQGRDVFAQIMCKL